MVPPPKRHVTVYCGVLSSHSKWRSRVVPKAPAAAEGPGGETLAVEKVPGQAEGVDKKPKARGSRYIPWHELLRRTFGEEIVCPSCGGSLRLIALVKTERTIQTILSAMHLPTGPPKIFDPGPALSGEEDLEWKGGDEALD